FARAGGTRSDPERPAKERLPRRVVTRCHDEFSKRRAGRSVRRAVSPRMAGADAANKRTLASAGGTRSDPERPAMERLSRRVVARAAAGDEQLRAVIEAMPP
uniref:hypothetical protein n=1 Tax=Sinimarinibacterium flocculans TaxID=985250 RepID=UPI003516A721